MLQKKRGRKKRKWELKVYYLKEKKMIGVHCAPTEDKMKD